jgi:hypothetical protein
MHSILATKFACKPGQSQSHLRSWSIGGTHNNVIVLNGSLFAPIGGQRLRQASLLGICPKTNGITVIIYRGNRESSFKVQLLNIGHEPPCIWSVDSLFSVYHIGEKHSRAEISVGVELKGFDDVFLTI